MFSIKIRRINSNKAFNTNPKDNSWGYKSPQKTEIDKRFACTCPRSLQIFVESFKKFLYSSKFTSIGTLLVSITVVNNPLRIKPKSNTPILVKRSANAKRASNYKLYNTVRPQLYVT